jgi:hypothetical protein
MALQALNEQQQQAIVDSPLMRQEYSWKILNKAAYFKGITTGDLLWARSLAVAQSLINNPNIVFGDAQLMQFFMLSVKVRNFLFYDPIANPTVDIAIMVAYMESQSQFDYLVDDYFAAKIKQSVAF